MNFSLEGHAQQSPEPKILSLEILESNDFQRRKSAEQIRLARVSYDEWRLSVKKDAPETPELDKEPTDDTVMRRWIIGEKALAARFDEFVRRKGNLERIEEAQTYGGLRSILREVEGQQPKHQSQALH